jgi:uncharacterized protein involved in cysteine biosynthesis
MEPILQEKITTTKIIAKLLLFSFIISVGILLIINISVFQNYKDDKLQPQVKDWFELLKNALILLGTSLTTIIGYYFGQRNAEQAEKKASLLEKENEKADDAVKGYMEQMNELKNTIASIGIKDDPLDIVQVTRN